MREVEMALRRGAHWNRDRSETEKFVVWDALISRRRHSERVLLRTRPTAPRQMGAISRDTLLHNFRQGEILPPGRTNEQEVERIKADGPPQQTVSGRGDREVVTWILSGVGLSRLTVGRQRLLL